MKFITFCEFTPEFLKLPLEERGEHLNDWKRLAAKHRIKVIFHGLPMGVTEHLVVAFETKNNGEEFFSFEREWLGLGTLEAGKHIKNLRSITVY